jgi:S1-C subfamily serine protease
MGPACRSSIDADSVAASKGFVGDTMLQVDNKAVSIAKDFQSAIDAVKSSGRATALRRSATANRVSRTDALREVIKYERIGVCSGSEPDHSEDDD